MLCKHSLWNHIDLQSILLFCIIQTQGNRRQSLSCSARNTQSDSIGIKFSFQPISNIHAMLLLCHLKFLLTILIYLHWTVARCYKVFLSEEGTCWSSCILIQCTIHGMGLFYINTFGCCGSSVCLLLSFYVVVLW